MSRKRPAGDRYAALAAQGLSGIQIARQLDRHPSSVYAALLLRGIPITDLRAVRCVICGRVMRKAKSTVADGRNSCPTPCKDRLRRLRKREIREANPQPPRDWHERARIVPLGPQIINRFAAGQTERQIARELVVSRSGLNRWRRLHAPWLDLTA